MHQRNLMKPLDPSPTNTSFAPPAAAATRLRSTVFTMLPVILLASVFVQGCSSMGTAGPEKSAALGRLSPTDRQVAMSGEVYRGFSKDAVYAAWGTPSKTSTTATPQGVRECWTYTRTFNGYGGGYYGISRGLVHGKHGDHYNTDNFYPAPDSSQTLGARRARRCP